MTRKEWLKTKIKKYQQELDNLNKEYIPKQIQSQDRSIIYTLNKLFTDEDLKNLICEIYAERHSDNLVKFDIIDRNNLFKALSKLRQNQLEVLCLRLSPKFREQKQLSKNTFKEIGETFGVTQSAVRESYTKALRHLRMSYLSKYVAVSFVRLSVCDYCLHLQCETCTDYKITKMLEKIKNDEYNTFNY